MTRGILYLTMGSEYTKLGLATISHSRAFTTLPIHIIGNVPIADQWLHDNNVQMTLVDIPDNQNRDIKTNPIDYTPFDQTLYLDCDSVINKPCIENVFDFLTDHDMVLHRFMGFHEGKRLFKIYREAMKTTNTTLPMNVYSGAFVGFNKNDKVRQFFQTWNQFWKLNGSGRDMPSLACAVKHSDINLKEIGEVDKIFSVMGADPTRIVVHRGDGHRSLKDLFGIDKHKPNKPFDRSGMRGAWSMVDFNA